MSTIPVVTGENTEVLREVAKPVETVDASIRKLGREMRATMHAEKGIGLAAPQVGVSKRVIIATIGDKVVLMVNPEIRSFSMECEVGEEGCLSLPGQFGNVSRAKWVKLRYLDEKGVPVECELSKLDARVVQHEIDHLNGVLFVDRLIREENPAFSQTARSL